MIAARTDVVGSLLRPPELLEARECLDRGEIGPPEFKRVEDAAVDAAIRLQEGAGLAVVTDGEMRRLSFQSQLTEAVEGFSGWDLDAFLWGDWHGDEVGDKRIQRPPVAVLGRLRRRRFLSAEEFTYARGRTERIIKITLPSPSLFANFYDPERSRGAYPSLESFLADVAETSARRSTSSYGSAASTSSSTRPTSAAPRFRLSRLLREQRLAGRALARPRP